MKRAVAREEGMVLLLVLVVVALVASLLVEFAFSTLVDLRLTETYRDSTRAYYLAKGGVQVGRMILQQDNNDYDAPDEMWAQGVTNYPVGEGSVTVQIEDLNGRLAINQLVDATDNPNTVFVDRFMRLFTELGLERPGDLVAALIDWIDLNNVDYQGVGEGAEDAWYQSLQHPYPCKNGPLDTLDELGLVRGFTPEVRRLIAPYVTVYGGPRVNVNTAPAEVLLSLADEMTPDAAQTIIDARRSAPFEAVSDLQELPGMDTLYGFIHLAITTTSSTYRVAATGHVGDGSRRIQAVIRKTDDNLLFFRVD